MEKLIELAHKLQSYNPYMLIGGSLSLYLRGIDLGRPVRDIDLLRKRSDSPLPFDFRDSTMSWDENTDREMFQATDYEDGSFIWSRMIDGIKVDLLKCDDDAYAGEVIDGLKVATVESLIRAKLLYVTYCSRRNFAKHHKDLATLSKHPFIVREGFEEVDRFLELVDRHGSSMAMRLWRTHMARTVRC